MRLELVGGVAVEPRQFQPSSRARRDATSHHPADPSLVLRVSTLIPREAGCDVDGGEVGPDPHGPFQPSSRARRDATSTIDSKLVGRRRFQPSSRARRDATILPTLHVAHEPVVFQPSSRARRDATIVGRSYPHDGDTVSTLIPREAGCDMEESP